MVKADTASKQLKRRMSVKALFTLASIVASVDGA